MTLSHNTNQSGKDGGNSVSSRELTGDGEEGEAGSSYLLYKINKFLTLHQKLHYYCSQIVIKMHHSEAKLTDIRQAQS